MAVPAKPVNPAWSALIPHDRRQKRDYRTDMQGAEALEQILHGHREDDFGMPGNYGEPTLRGTGRDAGGRTLLCRSREIGRRYPAAKIVHWLGVYKLGRQLDRELEQLFFPGNH